MISTDLTINHTLSVCEILETEKVPRTGRKYPFEIPLIRQTFLPRFFVSILRPTSGANGISSGYPVDRLGIGIKSDRNFDSRMLLRAGSLNRVVSCICNWRRGKEKLNWNRFLFISRREILLYYTMFNSRIFSFFFLNVSVNCVN